jgi:hypothetical protein
MVKRVLSYSLFGDKRKYYVGALENVILARYVYPGWVLRFYVDETADPAVVESLKNSGCEIVVMARSNDSADSSWRFLVAADDTVERWAIRDADSRLGYRERRAVTIDRLGLPFHIMRDHINHHKAIMGCSFDGVRARSKVGGAHG